MQALYQVALVSIPLAEVSQLSWLNRAMPPQLEIYCLQLIEGVVMNWDDIMTKIRTFSHKDVSQISTVVRCILMIGLHELQSGRLDARIIIDDLLNLTRKYDGKDSVAFVNGVLDRALEDNRQK